LQHLLQTEKHAMRRAGRMFTFDPPLPGQESRVTKHRGQASARTHQALSQTPPRAIRRIIPLEPVFGGSSGHTRDSARHVKRRGRRRRPFAIVGQRSPSTSATRMRSAAISARGMTRRCSSMSQRRVVWTFARRRAAQPDGGHAGVGDRPSVAARNQYRNTSAISTTGVNCAPARGSRAEFSSSKLPDGRE